MAESTSYADVHGVPDHEALVQRFTAARARVAGAAHRTPVVRSVYSGLKQITETFFAKSEKSFDRTCLVQFPRPGSWAVGFLAASQCLGQLRAFFDGEGSNVSAASPFPECIQR